MKNIKWTQLLLELLVVIFGVSIAFYLDNWKEIRKSKKTELEYLTSFKNDLEQDTLQLSKLIDTLKHQNQNCQNLIRCIYSNNLEDEHILDYSISLMFITNFIPHAATYKSMASSGQLSLITDFELRKKLVDQYDITYSNLELLDRFNQTQVFDYKLPYIHDNMQYQRGGISNTEAMKTNKYVNMTLATYHFLNKKIDEYSAANNLAKELILELEVRLHN
jgi:hypothetical protein